MAPFIDSHAHLADPAFDGDRDRVVERARAAGAEAVVCIGESLAAADRAAGLAAAHPGVVFFTAGIHPHDAADFRGDPDIAAIRQHLLSGAVAVGECGLDYHYDHSPREHRRAAFDAQLTLAGELRRPAVVHTRDAESDTQSFVLRYGAAGVLGVLHCFTGTPALAQAALNVGWYISFSGVITFRSWSDESLLRLVPADRLLVESDAPYLAPVPERGKRNEPALVVRTIARLAAARGRDVEQLSIETAANARRLFGLPDVAAGDHP